MIERCEKEREKESILSSISIEERIFVGLWNKA
jgi:hypothetical protein